MQRKNHGHGNRDGADDPTPGQICLACRDIQDGWTQVEERVRRTGTSTVEPYEVQIVATPIEFDGEAIT